MKYEYRGEKIQTEAINSEHGVFTLKEYNEEAGVEPRLNNDMKIGGKIFTRESCLLWRGRVSRSTCWLKGILPGSIIMICVVALSLTNGLGSFLMFGGALCLPALCLCLAVIVKRCHDRNRSGWFALFFLVPPLTVWCFVELGFLKGSRGANEYGLKTDGA